MMSIAMIQAINVQRANRWHGGDFHQWTVLEWAGALCGEAGEAANIAKKIRRNDFELDGNRYSDHVLQAHELREKLAHECADTFLYLVLLAASYDIDLEDAIRERFNSKSIEMGFPERL